MAPRIRYLEGCLGAHALNQIGDRWALLVVRELIFAPKRFQMLRAGLPEITASVLNGRLAQLIQAGVVQHDARFGVYSLTPLGTGLLPVLEALCRWALLVPGHEHTWFISPSALMISMGVTFLPDLSRSLSLTAGFEFGSEAFEMHVSDGRLSTVACRKPETDFVFSGTGNTVARAVYGPTGVADLAQEGVITLRGEINAAQAFVDLFRLALQPPLGPTA